MRSLLFSEAFAGTLPIVGSETAAMWDSLYYFLLWLSVFFFVLVVGAMIYFSITYKHQAGRKTKYITGNHLLEGLWIAIPTILLMIIFGWGYSVYHTMTQAPSDAYEVRVIGKQWLWNFQYDNGRTTVNELFVPMNRPVKLIMTSEDVIHSFFIPNFRIKQDVVPGLYSSVWFTATVSGRHQVFCAEFCGTSHSGMLAKLIALDDDQWERWNRGEKIGEIPDATDEGPGETPELAENASVVSPKESKPSENAPKQSAGTVMKGVAQNTLVEQGRAIYHKNGCTACHTVDGTEKIGPSFKGLYGRPVKLANGKILPKADDNYIKGHIENPRAFTIVGYSPSIMPTFKGLISPTEMNALIEFIKDLK